MSSNTLRDYNTISDEWNSNRKNLKCCRDIIKAVNIRLIDWFNEIYRDRYSSLTSPKRGYYIFNTDNEEAVMHIQFCPFCGKSLGSLEIENEQSNK
jgi:hypothetical protein